MKRCQKPSLSSPLLKAQRARQRDIKRKLLWRLLISPAILFVLLILCFKYYPQSYADEASVYVEGRSPDPVSVSVHPDEPPDSIELPLDVTDFKSHHSYPETSTRSLTALLPLTSDSLPRLEAIILNLLGQRSHLQEIMISCPHALLSPARIALKKAVAKNHDRNHIEISLHPLPHTLNNIAAVMELASEVTTAWIMFLDELGLDSCQEKTQESLLNPLAVPLPAGPRGILHLPANISCIYPSDVFQSASFLIPPFVLPSELLGPGYFSQPIPQSWSEFGHRISQNRLGDSGGVVIPSEATVDWCHLTHSNGDRPLDSSTWPSEDTVNNSTAGMIPERNRNSSLDHAVANISLTMPPILGTFAVLLPSSQELQLFSVTLCRLQGNGHVVHVLLYGDEDVTTHSSRNSETPFAIFGDCRLTYDVVSVEDLSIGQEFGPPYVLEWLDNMDRWPGVVITLRGEDTLSHLGKALKSSNSPQPTLLTLPSSDLLYCEWMSSLSIEEWRNWNSPRIEIAVITNDRPDSLGRLLASVSGGRLFGDIVNMRLNLEQSSDAQTMQIVERFHWEHGSTTIHRRVILGGLLPAVVESWYPTSNHSYGLLLEDDVEVSPMFYAWAKMAILRYRYGHGSNTSPQLFGISLYQQKNIELKLQGRRPFDARALFHNHGLPHPHTPYLSQIPCSWGAVYFPEHWREFHEYLAVRLSEHLFTIDEEIVPDVRSNRWTKSWKKFFIELAYLRGYVMLYPNYEDFVSLSTNHLEVGSHVKDRPGGVYHQRKELFFLPLMPLPDKEISSPSPGLLDLPDQTLPSWSSLPVLNLTGSLASFENLIHLGQHRRDQLTGCSHAALRPHDMKDLMCVNDDTN